ncbi:Hypothetical protein HVR_LOCUS589 [uncultured virus]|nr:Hypothetical protein HVR_LOCUS589 [uncultured virus]
MFSFEVREVDGVMAPHLLYIGEIVEFAFMSTLMKKIPDVEQINFLSKGSYTMLYWNSKNSA